MTDDPMRQVITRQEPNTISAKVRLIIERFRALGGIPEMCDLAWQLCEENEQLRAQAKQHRCSGCGLRWDISAKGAELCGDCWRRAQPILHATVPAQEPPADAHEDLDTTSWFALGQALRRHARPGETAAEVLDRFIGATWHRHLE
jgi:hypothetical protein